MSSPRVVLVLLCGLSGCVSEYHAPEPVGPFGPEPEHVPAAVVPNNVVVGELIDHGSDVDEFTLAVVAGSEFAVFFQSTHLLELLVFDPDGQPVATVAIDPDLRRDTTLFRQSSGRFRVDMGGIYRVRVAPLNPAVPDAGLFRFLIHQVDRRPEEVEAAITPRDTIVGEQIDPQDDIDEFTFPVEQGGLIKAFFQAQSGNFSTALVLHLVDASGEIIGEGTLSQGSDTTMMQASARVAAASSGEYRLRVSGVTTISRLDRGPYRLFLYLVDPAPEHVGAEFTFGDSLSGEVIELPGDLDEYWVTTADSTGANIVMESDDEDFPAPAQILVYDLSGALRASSVPDVSGFAQTGRFLLSPGEYRIVVEGGSLAQGLRPVPYRVWFYRFRQGPESSPDTIVVGDTVSSEALFPPGDQDIFRFYAVQGQHIEVALQGMAPSATTGFEIGLFVPGESFLRALVRSPGAIASLDERRTSRFDIPVTGWYRLSVTGVGSPAPLSGVGSYRFVVQPFSTLPEAADSALLPGDSVTTEQIDSPGDWDEYEVNAAPGEELGVAFSSAGSTWFPYIRVFDGATGSLLAQTVGQFERFAGPFRVPASGKVRVAVFQEPVTVNRFCFDRCEDTYPWVGAYRFQVIRVDRAPENLPASFAVGDTVRGEAVATPGDIDEFISTWMPGDSLAAWYRAAEPAVPGAWIAFEVVDPQSGEVLPGSEAIKTVPGPFAFPVSFVVPSSGSFLIRVRGRGESSDQVGTGPFEFFVRRP